MHFRTVTWPDLRSRCTAPIKANFSHLKFLSESCVSSRPSRAIFATCHKPHELSPHTDYFFTIHIPSIHFKVFQGDLFPPNTFVYISGPSVKNVKINLSLGTPSQHTEGPKVGLHSFSHLALGSREWLSSSPPATLPPGKGAIKNMGPTVGLDISETKNIFPLPEFEPRTGKSVA